MSIELKQAAQQAIEAIQDLRGYRPDIDKAIEALRTAIQQSKSKHRHWSEALADDLTESGDNQTNAHPAPGVPDGYVLVPLQVLRDASDAPGNFINDLGWDDSDMQAWDNLDAYIAQHSAAQAQKG